MKTSLLIMPLASIAALAVACGAQAQTINIAVGSGLANVATVYRESTVMAEAYRKYVQENGTKLSGKEARALRGKLRGATVAHIRYQPPGNRPEILVHARSGRSIEGTIEQLTGAGGGSGSSTEAGETVSPTEQARDVGEARYYPADTPTSIRAVNLERKAGWVVQPYPGEDGRVIHGGDAELKALRNLESRLAGNPALQGGRLTGYVSKTVCESCTRAFADFAETYGVSGNVYHLDETTVNGVAVSPGQQWSGTLRRMRTANVDTVLSDEVLEAGSMDWWSTPFEAARVAAAEAGVLAIPAACD
ncbi:hypothetical protein [Luteibacter sp.]|uniref:hypothetical protein n=1 Tax=Luteibacter sp. TaxID=1886636 RepID=UPI003F81219E